MASLTRRSEAQSEKRAAIESAVIEATYALLDEGASFADLPIERIARRAGISRTAFYFYFRDKRALLRRLTAGVAELLYAEAERWWRADGAATDDFRGAFAGFVRMYRRRAPLLRAIVEAAAYDEEVARFWREVVGRFVDATTARIEREQATGKVDPALPAAATAFALCWMLERTAYEHLVQERDLADPEIVAALHAIWMRTLYGCAR